MRRYLREPSQPTWRSAFLFDPLPPPRPPFRTWRWLAGLAGSEWPAILRDRRLTQKADRTAPGLGQTLGSPGRSGVHGSRVL